MFFFIPDEIMASSRIQIDSMNRSQSASSIQTNATGDSGRSVISRYSAASSQKRRGLLAKIGNGFQSIFRRFSRKHISLTEMEVQILSTITDFTREEVLQW